MVFLWFTHCLCQKVWHNSNIKRCTQSFLVYNALADMAVVLVYTDTLVQCSEENTLSALLNDIKHGWKYCIYRSHLHIRNPCNREFRMRVRVFEQHGFAALTNRNLLDLSDFCVSCSYIATLLTIDNGDIFLPAKFR